MNKQKTKYTLNYLFSSNLGILCLLKYLRLNQADVHLIKAQSDWQELSVVLISAL